VTTLHPNASSTSDPAASDRGEPHPADDGAPSGEPTWYEANQRYLVAALGLLRERLAGARDEKLDGARRRLGDATAAMPGPPALATLADAFGLSAFERELVLLCAGVELDGDFAAACAAAHGDPQRPQPTFGLALAVLPDAHWSAIGPAGTLRRFRLVDLGTGEALTRSPLRIDEHVLHFLTGAHQPDERLASLLDAAQPPGELPPSHRELRDRVAAVWAGATESLPVVQLCGGERSAKRAIAASVVDALGLRLDILPAGVLLRAGTDTSLAPLLTREAILGGSALYVDGDDLDVAEAAATAATRRLIELLRGPTFLSVRERIGLVHRAVVTFEVRRPVASEQEALWRRALGERGLDGEAGALAAPLVAQFDLAAPAIHNACAATAGVPPAELAEALWDACRQEARVRLAGLAQRIEPGAGWADLVLPFVHRRALQEVAMHVRQRRKVYGTWGFAEKGQRGLGISALFAGPSGTGKTMAAEVLARELRLDLFRIDLSQVVSKYIGETEKNLRRLFDAAEHGAAILLFDEADALFGKRSEVKDSHDRYANIEIGYLLQRMEAYRGLAILTTNVKNALDPAFLRRVRFVVQFPFPGVPERAEIWRGVFPAETPTEGLDFDRLARLNVAGGSIRNIALNAAFLAADAGEPVRMTHLIQAAQGEYAKLERPLTGGELT
jgi:hypothetical protein